jgi:hypothetical protein
VAAGPAIFPTLTAAQACEALREAGLALAPADVGVERREERWAVSLPDDRIAWFPATGLGLERLRIERRVLRLLSDRCTFGYRKSPTSRRPATTCAPWCRVDAIRGACSNAQPRMRIWRAD